MGEISEQVFLQKRSYKWLTSTWKRCSTWSAIREIPTKPRCGNSSHPTGRLASKGQVITSAGQAWRTRTLRHCCWEYKMGQPFWQRVWQFLKRVKRVSIWPNNSTPRHTTKTNQNTCPHKNLYPNINSNTIHINRKGETTQMPLPDKWLNKPWCHHALEQ